MKKRNIRIINFLYLETNQFNKIREYRNQEYIRNISINKNKITKDEHIDYFNLLKKEDKYFAFLVLNDEKDYGVITFKKIDNNNYYVGDYLVKEEYKFEGGGIVNRFCILYICNKLKIKYLSYDIKYSNSRGFRAGNISKVLFHEKKENFFSEISEVSDFFDEDILISKPRRLFDKLYNIKECQI